MNVLCQRPQRRTLQSSADDWYADAARSIATGSTSKLPLDGNVPFVRECRTGFDPAARP